MLLVLGKFFISFTKQMKVYNENLYFPEFLNSEKTSRIYFYTISVVVSAH